MKNFRTWLQQHSRSIGTISIAIAAPAALLLVQLGNLVQGISRSEWQVAHNSASLGAMAQHPQFLPVEVLHWLVGWLPWHSAFWLRLPSALLAGLTLAVVTYILRRWYGPRTAFFGFIIFACSSWVLHVSRLASFDISWLLALPLLLASYLWLRDRSESPVAFVAWLAVQLLMLYIPGMIWFVLLGLIWQREDIQEGWQGLTNWRTRSVAAIVAVAILAPLAYSLAVHYRLSVVLGLLGLPTTVPSALAVLRHFADGIVFIVARGTAPEARWLNHLPILDAFMICAFIVGVYFYAKHLGAARTRLLLGYGLLGLALFALNGGVGLTIIVPLLYLVAAAGIAYLLHLWLSVFPRNPLARGVGIGLLAIAIMVSCAYNLRQYFVAWPHHPETWTAFHDHTIPPSHL